MNQESVDSVVTDAIRGLGRALVSEAPSRREEKSEETDSYGAPFGTAAKKETISMGDIDEVCIKLGIPDFSTTAIDYVIRMLKTRTVLPEEVHGLVNAYYQERLKSDSGIIP